jgi:Tfp pilus assembly protein PilO
VKASDRAIIFGVVLAALAIGFYLLVLGPKRNTGSELENQISDLHASISAEQQKASFGEQARKEFPRYYGRLVVLGKAVPQQADTSSMLVQLNSIADRSNVRFSGISLSQGAGTAGTGTSSTSTPAPTSTPPPATAGTSTTPSAPASSGTSTTSSTTASATSGSSGSTAATASSTLVPATEASAASLPIGAVVGPAGLPTLPYNLTFKGTFFDISNFIGGVDGLVTPNDGGTQVSSNGRLFTVDGFALNVGLPGSAQKLSANFLVTTYVTPEDQGLTAGASPGGPAAPTSPAVPQAQPASAVVSK